MCIDDKQQEFQTEHRYVQAWEKDGKKIIECLDCGFKHFYPIPSKKEIEEFYRSSYYEEIKPFEYKSLNEEEKNKIINKVSLNQSFVNVYDNVTRINNTESISRKMMDVGCGNKLLSKYFQLKGWTSSAIELSENACKFLMSFDLDIFNISIEDLHDKLPVTDLSFINIQFVLEHLRSPELFLKVAHNSMIKGGVIRICVPNDFSPGQLAYQEYYGEDVRWYLYPDHINYFTFDSLSTLLNRNGFKEVYRRSNFPLEFLLLGGINYYSDKEAQKKVKPFVSNFENAFKMTGRKEILDQLYEKLAEIGLGRSIEIYAVKE